MTTHYLTDAACTTSIKEKWTKVLPFGSLWNPISLSSLGPSIYTGEETGFSCSLFNRTRQFPITVPSHAISLSVSKGLHAVALPQSKENGESQGKHPGRDERSTPNCLFLEALLRIYRANPRLRQRGGGALDPKPSSLLSCQMCKEGALNFFSFWSC